MLAKACFLKRKILPEELKPEELKCIIFLKLILSSSKYFSKKLWKDNQIQTEMLLSKQKCLLKHISQKEKYYQNLNQKNLRCIIL